MILKERLKPAIMQHAIKNMRDRFARHRILTALIVYIFLIGIFFFSYHALEATGTLARIKRIADREIYKIPINYLKGLFVLPKQLVIDVKYKDYQKIAYNRYIALKRGCLTESYREEVPAKVHYNGEVYRAQIRLKGKISDHWNTDRWSLRIQIKDNKTIDGMQEFYIQHPGTRDGLTEWYYKRLLEYNGLMFQRYDFVDVVINGKNKGIYDLEEAYGKYLVENNQRREGPIIYLNDDYFWEWYTQGADTPRTYQESYWIADIEESSPKKTQKKEELQKAFLKARDLVDAFRSGAVPASKVFDIKKTAKLFAISDLCGYPHPHEYHNVRFYYNPLTSVLEPIGSDIQYLMKTDYLRGSAGKIERYNYITWEERLFQDSIFFGEYIRALEEISEELHLKNFFAKTEKEAQHKLNILYKSYPWYRFKGKQILCDNQKRIREFLNPYRGVKAFLNNTGQEEGKIKIMIGNTQTLPIEVVGLLYKDSILFKPEAEVMLAGKPFLEPIEYTEVSFYKPDASDISNNISPEEIKIKYRLIGSNKYFLSPISDWPYSSRYNIMNDFARRQPNIDNFEFLSIDNQERTISFKKGEYNIIDTIIIPAGYKVSAGEGTKILLSAGAAIISYSPLIFIGSDEFPIIISADPTGEGIVVLNSQESSLFKNVHFDGLSNPSDEGWMLSGAVTFYESPVTIENCVFTNNRKGDDYLNIVRSDFLIKKAYFLNSASDAFDSDFSKGKIIDSEFKNCGNDAIDFAGSTAELENLRIEHAGDKGISVGEESKVNAVDLKITGAKIGMASKDMSELNINKIEISDCDTGLAAYMKKNEFGPAIINISDVDIRGVSTPYLTDKDSNIILHGRKVDIAKDHLKKILTFNGD